MNYVMQTGMMSAGGYTTQMPPFGTSAPSFATTAFEDIFGGSAEDVYRPEMEGPSSYVTPPPVHVSYFGSFGLIVNYVNIS